LREYENKFARPNRPTRTGKNVVIVDDGLATGATVEAAVLSARKQEARSITVAVPVASTSGAARIERICPQFYALLIDPQFEAVGQYYRSFAQTTDGEVQEALAGVAR
jgi:predicted phosphoribosyltransferase